MSFYDYSVPTPDGKEISMRDYEGKVVVVVNTATGCGFTPHYKDLEAIYERFHNQGLEIVDVPCNQFAGQTPGTDEEIHQFCQLKYNTRFPQMRKSDVNGENALPLFTFLKSQQGFKGFRGLAAIPMKAMLKRIGPNYESNPDIKWNFTKFVVNREGQVVARFEPTDSMKDVAACVASLM